MAFDVLSVALRGAGFVAALQAAGVALFVAVLGDRWRSSEGAIRALGHGVALAGVLLVVAHLAFEPARLVGSLRGLLDPSLHGLLLASDAGTAAAVRALGLVLIAVGLAGDSRGRGALAAIGAALVAASFAFVGHTAANDQHALLAVLLILHLLAVAFWFGGLAPLHLGSSHDDLSENAAVIERFSAIAIVIAPSVLVLGVGLAVALLPSWEALRSPYGLVLIGKAAAFALLMLLASFNRWRLAPRIAAGKRFALATFRRSVVAEWWLIAAVLVATAAMTSLTSPVSPQ